MGYMEIILIKYKYLYIQPQNAKLALENPPQKIRKRQQRMQTMHMPNGSDPQIRPSSVQKMLQRKRKHHWIHQNQMIICSYTFLTHSFYSQCSFHPIFCISYLIQRRICPIIVYLVINTLMLIQFNLSYLTLVTLLMMKPSLRREQRLYYRSASAKSKSERSQGEHNLSVRNNIKQKPLNTSAHVDLNNINYLGLNKVEIGRLKRNSVKMTHKSVEELFEENLQLRKQNHAISQQVSQLRGKFQANAKNSSERGKQLDLEFEKQLYWGGSKTNLISGIKYQYQKLQKKYKQQQIEYNKVKAQLFETKQPEYKIYSEQLEDENKRLTQKLQKMSSYPINSAGNPNKVSEAIAAEFNQQIQKLNQRLRQADTQIEALKQEVNQKQKKILFLEKLLIQKDNSQYHGHRKVKKLDKTVEELKLINNKLNQQIVQLSKKHKEDLRNTSHHYEICKKEVREQSKKQIQQLRNKIEGLLEDKNELQNAISKMKMNSSMIHSGSSVMKIADKRMLSSINKGNLPKKDQPTQIMKLLPGNMANSIEHGDDLFKGYESEIQSQTEKQKKPRVMRTADKKHSYLSKKLRKVQHSEVTQIGQFVKLRMIAANISFDEMKKFFNRNPLNSSRDIEWEQQHINFSQTKLILKSYPFLLEDEPASLLARYLIEDCNQQYVYCDESNENKREIVKSIMKSLIGNYKLADEAIEAEINDFKSKYLDNFYSALKTYYPQGKVGRRKFVQILTNMGTELSPKSTEVILARVISKSSSLLEIEYKALEEL